MSVNAAGNYLNYVAQIYDKYESKVPLPDLLPINTKEKCADHQEKMGCLSDNPLFEKTNEYNGCQDMASWYTETDPLSPLRDAIYVGGVLDPERISQRRLESDATEYSALCHLTAIGQQVEGVIPLALGKAVIMASNPPPPKLNSEESDSEETSEQMDVPLQWAKGIMFKALIPPIFNIISPKSQLDNLVFEKAYCNATLEERIELIKRMDAACKDLNLNRDRLLYKIQGIFAYVFDSPLSKGILFIGFTYVVMTSYSAIVLRVIDCFWVVIIPQCTAFIDLQAPLQVGQACHTLLNTAVAINTFRTTADLVHWAASNAIGFGTSYAIYYTAPVLPILAKGIKVCNYIVLPRNLIWAYARQYIHRLELLAHKVLSGVEYKTRWAIQEKFVKDPVACEQGLKAHALFLRIMQKGTPEDALMLSGWLPIPSPAA